MREDVGRLIRARPGDVVLIHAQLPKLSAEANLRVRLSVWSRNPGFDFAPHVQLAHMGIIRDGKPDMVQPMSIILDTNIAREKQITFIADELLDFRVRQEGDLDFRVKVKVARYNIRVYRFIQWMRKVTDLLTFNRARGLRLQ